ncbi:unnamed protein product [Amoebophrya sp. A120]|nr:unnamed protein product [Amoebophrya sp. A120]|eukprot:GSA120T00019671001.1
MEKIKSLIPMIDKFREKIFADYFKNLEEKQNQPKAGYFNLERKPRFFVDDEIVEDDVGQEQKRKKNVNGRLFRKDPPPWSDSSVYYQLQQHQMQNFINAVPGQAAQAATQIYLPISSENQQYLQLLRQESPFGLGNEANTNIVPAIPPNYFGNGLPATFLPGAGPEKAPFLFGRIPRTYGFFGNDGKVQRQQLANNLMMLEQQGVLQGAGAAAAQLVNLYAFQKDDEHYLVPALQTALWLTERKLALTPCLELEKCPFLDAKSEQLVAQKSEGTSLSSCSPFRCIRTYNYLLNNCRVVFQGLGQPVPNVILDVLDQVDAFLENRNPPEMYLELAPALEDLWRQVRPILGLTSPAAVRNETLCEQEEMLLRHKSGAGAKSAKTLSARPSSSTPSSAPVLPLVGLEIDNESAMLSAGGATAGARTTPGGTTNYEQQIIDLITIAVKDHGYRRLDVKPGMEKIVAAAFREDNFYRQQDSTNYPALGKFYNAVDLVFQFTGSGSSEQFQNFEQKQIACLLVNFQDFVPVEQLAQLLLLTNDKQETAAVQQQQNNNLKQELLTVLLQVWQAAEQLVDANRVKYLGIQYPTGITNSGELGRRIVKEFFNSELLKTQIRHQPRVVKTDSTNGLHVYSDARGGGGGTSSRPPSGPQVEQLLGDHVQAGVELPRIQTIASKLTSTSLTLLSPEYDPHVVKISQYNGRTTAFILHRWALQHDLSVSVGMDLALRQLTDRIISEGHTSSGAGGIGGHNFVHVDLVPRMLTADLGTTTVVPAATAEEDVASTTPTAEVQDLSSEFEDEQGRSIACSTPPKVKENIDDVGGRSGFGAASTNTSSTQQSDRTTGKTPINKRRKTTAKNNTNRISTRQMMMLDSLSTLVSSSGTQIRNYVHGASSTSSDTSDLLTTGGIGKDENEDQKTDYDFDLFQLKKAATERSNAANEVEIIEGCKEVPPTGPQMQRLGIEQMKVQQQIDTKPIPVTPYTRNVGRDCWAKLWVHVGCLEATVPNYTDWHAEQSYLALLQDAGNWATLEDETHRKTCYGKAMGR